MTSASELFYNRRSRLGRSQLELGFDSSVDRISHHQNSNRRHHHHHSNARRDRLLDLTGCDPVRRTPQPRHPHHRAAFFDREAGWLNRSNSETASRNVNNSENGNNIRDRMRFPGNDRLPGAVLLARERLLQRLRGVSLSGNRRNNRISASIYHDITSEDDFRLAGVGDWETDISREWTAGRNPSSDSLWGETRKRPPGLNQEALGCLPVEVFVNLDSNDGETKLKLLQECSICLESFLEGDELICLLCGHKFHSCCLYPWVRTCGDCPYCRAVILVTPCRTKERL